MGKRLLVPALIGFVLLWVVLRPVGRALLFGLEVSPAVYTAVIWSALAATVLLVTYLVIRGFGLSRPRGAVAVTLSAILVVVAGAIASWMITAVRLNARWLYGEPATVAMMFLFSCLTCLLAFAVGTSFKRRASA